MRRLRLLLLPLLAVAGLRADNAEAAIARVSPAVVRIEVISEEGGEGRVRRQTSVGSGAIIDAAGHVLTNYHVAGRGTAFLCRLADGEELPAALVGADAMTDLAVIRLDLARRAPGAKPLVVAEFGRSSELMTGDVVFSMGCPAGLNQSVTRGIVANPRMIMTRFVGQMDLDGESVGELVRWIGHDAVIFGGNSGGPLVDARGRIVGVNELGVGSLGGAIPSDTAKPVAEALIRDGRVRRSWTGIEARPLLRSQAGARGVLVEGVLPDSPASAAGIAQGDILLALGGAEVHAADAEGMPDFGLVETSLPVGKPVEARLRRGDRELAVSLVPAEREPRLAREAELAAWGATFRELTAFSARRLRRPDTAGVLVDSLRAGGPAELAKPPLQSGDLILRADGRDVRALADLRAATRAALGGAEPRPVVIGFRRGDADLVAVVRVGPETDPAPVPRVPKAWAGISTQVLLPELAKALGVDARSGLRVTQLVPGGAAEKAGLRVGDVLLRLDGKVIPTRRPEDAEWFGSTLREYDPSAKVTIDLIRDGKPAKVELPLAERPAPASELPTVRDLRLGFSARALGFDDRQERRLGDKEGGVVVTRVERSGWADLAGLRAGDILTELNGRALASNDDLRAVLDALAADRPRHVVLRVRRGVTGSILECEPDWAALAAAEAR